MRILAIDPGPTESAAVLFDTKTRKVIEHGKVDNELMLANVSLSSGSYDVAVIEMIASYGMPVGAEVFETCVWIGRFLQVIGEKYTHRIFRKDVKLSLCHKVQGVNDGVIRQRLIDLFGGKEKAIGKKKTPGPLYGISGDCWAALAVAIAWEMQHNKQAGP